MPILHFVPRNLSLFRSLRRIASRFGRALRKQTSRSKETPTTTPPEELLHGRRRLLAGRYIIQVTKWSFDGSLLYVETKEVIRKDRDHVKSPDEVLAARLLLEKEVVQEYMFSNGSIFIHRIYRIAHLLDADKISIGMVWQIHPIPKISYINRTLKGT